jgi:hypothetical protein
LQGFTGPVGHSNFFDPVDFQLTAVAPGMTTVTLAVDFETNVGCAERPFFQFVYQRSEPFTVNVLPLRCVGDCNQNGFVTVDEVVLGVNIALERPGTTIDECLEMDTDQDRKVAVNELVQAVGGLLQGCGS